MVNVTNNIRKYIFPFAVTCTLLLLMCGCKKNETFTVTFDSNGGTGTMQPQIFIEDEPQALRLNEFTCDNCKFGYWSPLKQHVFSTPESPKNEYRNGETITVSANMILYAHWERNTAIVTFNANGGTGEMTPQTFTIGVAQALSTNSFTRENCIFLGWNTVQDGSGATYSEMQEITIEENITLYAQWMIPTGQQGGHYYVDLGLPSGTLWATCNVGAVNPTDYGDYFAWGETTVKEIYNWTTYRYCNGDERYLTKYCNNGSYGYNGFTDELTTLEASDDVATVNWGVDWRMPKCNELEELNDYCTVIWTTQNGVNGRMFTGPNGNSIFLPAAGFRSSVSLSNVGVRAYYWSSSLYVDEPCQAKYLNFISPKCEVGQLNRFIGFSVRPVLIENN